MRQRRELCPVRHSFAGLGRFKVVASAIYLDERVCQRQFPPPKTFLPTVNKVGPDLKPFRFKTERLSSNWRLCRPG